MGILDYWTGREIEIPDKVKKILSPGEKAIFAAQMARAAQLTAPDNLVLTTERVIAFRPKLLGLKSDIEDYRYADIGNIKLEKGFLSAKIIMKMRFLSDDITFENIPKDSADKVFKMIQEAIRTGPVMSPQSSGVVAGDPLQVLKMRFAKGEISKSEYEEMKKTLE